MLTMSAFAGTYVDGSVCLCGTTKEARSCRWHFSRAVVRVQGLQRLAQNPEAVGTGVTDLFGDLEKEGAALSKLLEAPFVVSVSGAIDNN